MQQAVYHATTRSARGGGHGVRKADFGIKAQLAHSWPTLSISVSPRPLLVQYCQCCCYCMWFQSQRESVLDLSIMMWYILPAFLVIYLYLLSVRLTSPHPKAEPRSVSPADLDNVKYNGINMLHGIPAAPTNKTYAVIGGSGFVGTCVDQHC
jgi:hypothetical protein